MNPDPSQADSFSFFSHSSFFKAERITESAWVQHTPFAFWLIEQVKPKLFVELGVHTGMSYFAFCQSVEANSLTTQCYGVDTWRGDEHAGLYSEDIWLDVNGYNTHKYASFSTLLRTTFKEALHYFEPNTIGLLHIDGYHTYEAVKEDFEDWLPKMAPDGIVIFHDILVREREFGVFRLWSELKEQYKTFEFYHGHGLGVLALDTLSSQVLNAFFSLTDENEISKIRTAYSELGSRFSEKLRIKQLENDVRDISSKYQYANLQWQHATQEHALLLKQHENVKAQLHHAHLEYEHLKAKNEQLRQDMDRFKSQYDYAKLEYDQLKSTLDQFRQSHDHLEEKLQLEAVAQQQYKENFDHLKGQYDYAKLEYDKLLAYTKELEGKLKTAQELSDKFTAQHQVQLTTLTQDLVKEKALVEKLQIELEQQQQKINWYQEKYEGRKLMAIIKDRLQGK